MISPKAGTTRTNTPGLVCVQKVYNSLPSIWILKLQMVWSPPRLHGYTLPPEMYRLFPGGKKPSHKHYLDNLYTRMILVYRKNGKPQNLGSNSPQNIPSKEKPSTQKYKLYIPIQPKKMQLLVFY